MVSTLPTNLILDQAERDAIERHVADLEACYGPTPADDPSAEEKMVVVVTKMMLVLPAMKQNEASAETRGEAYMMALDDVPTWAVAAAVRRWFRGNAGDGHDYHWCPAPAELRELSLIELWRVKSRAKILRNLLRAEPLIEFSEEHCAMMRMRIADLFKGKLGIQPVGHDGSGGMVNAS